ncbi:hypothetical protein IV203_007607 [Nitzschia inconspicua]|uniref:Uncharacterized protein n=1 Tax=Nitzschia inconspicua TaxID=303405 RepID=A0A9K3KF10_9STRA|nr:hypothetical protein IV203_007607 [Nitzschia inconspicua]
MTSTSVLGIRSVSLSAMMISKGSPSCRFPFTRNSNKTNLLPLKVAGRNHRLSTAAATTTTATIPSTKSFSVKGVSRNKWYSSTTIPLQSENGGGSDEQVQLATAAANTEPPAPSTSTATVFDMRQVSLEYNRRRANYRRQVSELRKVYRQEQLQHQAQDAALQEEERQQQLRRRLERQRAKNERSAINAHRQEELRRQAHLAFQDHLQRQQQLRTAKNELKRRARQLLIEELEQEAPLWMTNKDEVDAAFTTQAEQLLWGRPQGVLGVPNPSLDSHFWQYQGHTWNMAKTYQTQSDMLLQDLEEQAYLQTNLDPSVWTTEQHRQQQLLEQKAKLRALVRQEGRKALLKRQKEFLDTDHETKDGEPPKPMPVPSLGVLANIRAQEKEGVELLLKDPTNFFVFDNNNNNNINNNQNISHSTFQGDDDMTTGTDTAYAGPSLGTPIQLRDPLRDPNGGSVFPVAIGKLPKADTRTDKEKKRQEREERLWAATQQAKKKEEGDLELLIPEEDRVFGEAIDYDNNDDWDSDDEEWEKGLDPDLDSKLIDVPREFRYREQDLDLVIQELEKKAANLQSHIRNTVQTMEQEARSRMDRVEETNAIRMATTETTSTTTTTSSITMDDLAIDNMAADLTTDMSTQPFFDAETSTKLRAVGADVDKYERLMASFSQDQLLSLFALEGQPPARRDNNAAMGIDEAASSSLPTSIFEGIPNITPEQVIGLTELESFMKVLEKAAADEEGQHGAPP